MTETDIQRLVQIEASRNPCLRLWRNQVGEAWIGKAQFHQGTVVIDHARRITFGLPPGSPDLIGLKSVVVTPEMVGQRIAVFAGVEVKTDKGRVSDDQKRFLKMLNEVGALTLVARRPEDVREL